MISHAKKNLVAFQETYLTLCLQPNSQLTRNKGKPALFSNDQLV